MSPRLRYLLKTHRKNSFAWTLMKIRKMLHTKLIKMAAGPAPVLLNFNMEPQTQTNWCWAATTKSVSYFYDSSSTWSQCLIAQQAFSGSSCCGNPAPCNQPWLLHQALAITSNFVSYIGTLNFTGVEAQLLTGRVIGARTGWNGGGGHFMVIHGCRQRAGVNYLNIDDPIYGKSDIAETVFLSHYQGSGTWTHSYFTKP